MKNKNLLLGVFVLVALIQLFVPGKMIYDHERIIRQGREYKFKMAAYDPSDFIRGKYLNINYTNNEILISKKDGWDNGESVYVILNVGNDGYAMIQSVSRIMPASNVSFVKVRIRSLGTEKMFVEYPFNKYFLDESKAEKTQKMINDIFHGKDLVCYARVSINEGDFVIQDLIINGLSLNYMLKEGKEIAK
jgi:uncharacterized membrane-anchored protein